MKKITLVFTALCLLAVFGCNQNPGRHESHDHDHADHAHVYSCPMHPEVQQEKPGKCPICGMDLVLTDKPDTAATEQYVLKLATMPATVEAEKPATLAFRPTIAGKEGVDVPLELVHTKKMHLLIVSSDLSWFAHGHPEYKSSGTYDFSYTFPFAGEYLLYADYKPAGGSETKDKIALSVAGKPRAPISYTQNQLSSKSGAYEVRLSTPNGKFETGSQQHIAAKVTKDGKSVDPNMLEDYLGAKAHVVIIGLEAKDYLHVHPEIESGAFDLHATFENPGIYRCWLQYTAEGKMLTADFVLNVTKGSGDGSAKVHEHGGQDHSGHDHGGHDHSH